MLALCLEEKNVRLRKGLPIPSPGPGEALIRVQRAGICSTDRELASGMYGFSGILGHEFVGVVMEEGPGREGGARRLAGRARRGGDQRPLPRLSRVRAG